ncbi:MAG: apolipoprotein N-acyltransferase [Planctomycetes bacterium]|nr:apolipoprotein N-acyltransferase [Planctomycetota bacterium]
MRELAPLARLAWVLGAWGLLFLGTPGNLFPDGSGLLAIAGIALWGCSSCRPGRKAFWIEWLAAAIGISAICWWTTLVVLITLLGVAIVPALYMGLAGVMLRALARRIPLAFAVPLAWVGFETARAWIEPPFGFGWLRLGHYFSVTPFAGSARVWGVMGLSFAAAGCAGALADLISRRLRMTGQAGAPNGRGQAARAWIARALATGPLALAPVMSLATSPPPMEPGPRLLLVQPSFEQHRKMDNGDLLPELLARTREGAAASPARGGRPAIDLVCWGESLLQEYFESEGLESALTRGEHPPVWDRSFPGLASLRANERGVRDMLLSRKVMPPGAAFVTGTDVYLSRGGEIRRTTVAMVWGPDGQRLGWGAKHHLVPGGETMCGLERWAWVRDAAFSLAGYIPDLVPGEQTGVLTLPVAGFRSVRLGLSICFDNTFDDPYTEPLRNGALDAHLVLSNEAWYEETNEYDHMLAFSRLAAIESGRAMARVTNSGISCLFAADGSEISRLRVGGKDRMVGGSLLVDVPVPVAGHEGDRTPYVCAEPWLRWLLVLAPWLVLLLWRPRAVTP